MEKRRLGDLIGISWEGAWSVEPGSFQWCQCQEGRWWELEHRVPSEAVGLFPGDVQKLPGCGPGPPALGIPAGAGVGQRGTEGPASLSCFGILGKAIW